MCSAYYLAKIWKCQSLGGWKSSSVITPKKRIFCHPYEKARDSCAQKKKRKKRKARGSNQERKAVPSAWPTWYPNRRIYNRNNGGQTYAHIIDHQEPIFSFSIDFLYTGQFSSIKEPKKSKQEEIGMKEIFFFFVKQRKRKSITIFQHFVLRRQKNHQEKEPVPALHLRWIPKSETEDLSKKTESESNQWRPQ